MKNEKMWAFAPTAKPWRAAGAMMTLAAFAAGAGCSSSDAGGEPPAADAGADALVEAADDAASEASADGGADAPAEAAGDAATEAAVDAGAGPGFALVVATDFAASQSTALVVDLATNAKKDAITLPSTDTLAYASGGRAFLVERDRSKVDVLDAYEPWKVEKTIDVAGADDAGGPVATNPYAAVVAAGSKAYVVRYASNSLLTLDLAAGSAGTAIDLSNELSAGDPDGWVDAFDGVYDATSGRAYFVLQRIDQTYFGPGPDYVGACGGVAPLLVAVDVATDTLVDLDPSSPSRGLALLGADPTALAYDAGTRKLYVADVGCSTDPRGGRDRRGVEVVDLANPTPAGVAWTFHETGTERMGSLVVADAAHAWIGAGYPTTYYPWVPGAATIGAADANVPTVPAVAPSGLVIGMDAAGTSLVAFDPVSGDTTTLTQDLLAGVSGTVLSSAVAR